MISQAFKPFYERLRWLVEQFSLKRPVILEIVPDAKQEILTTNESHTIKLGPNSHILDLDDLVAVAKLGEEYDILLATLYFQKDLTPKESRYASEFALFTTPLRDFWSWKEMKKYLPEEEFEKNLDEMFSTIEILMKEVGVVQDRGLLVRLVSAKLIVETFTEVSFRLEGSQDWQEYIRLMERLKDEKPSAHLLATIPDEMGMDFTVSVVEDEDGRYYRVKERKVLEV